MQVITQSAGFASAPASAPGNLPRTRDGSVTLAELCDAYMHEYAGRDTTRAQRVAHWRAKLGHLKLSEIDDDTVYDAMAELEGARPTYYAGKDAHGRPILKAKRRPYAPATLNRFQAALSAVLTWAQRRRITPKGWVHPCRSIELKPENNQRVRFLSDDERRRLITAARASKWPRLAMFVLLGLTSGARRGEMEGLHWRDVDLERGEALVARSKNGDAKLLPLVPTVVEEMRKFASKPDELVFRSKRSANKVHAVEHAFETALQVAGIKDFHIHDMRHDCASAMAKHGASLLEIGDLLGHRQVQVTRRYAHLCTDAKKRLVHRVMAGLQ